MKRPKDTKTSPTPPPEKPAGAAPSKAPVRPDAAFDTWLQRGLHDLFDGIASEPIPEELLRILDEDQEK